MRRRRRLGHGRGRVLAQGSGKEKGGGGAEARMRCAYGGGDSGGHRHRLLLQRGHGGTRVRGEQGNGGLDGWETAEEVLSRAAVQSCGCDLAAELRRTEARTARLLVT